jgi:hypothetical protein
MRPQAEVDEQLNLAVEGVNNGSRWPGMSYEQGVEAALEWATGQTEDKPTEEN